MPNPEDTNCPLTCPNRRSRSLDKGITYSFALLLTIALIFQATIKTDETGKIHWSLNTRETPWIVSVIYGGLITTVFAIPMDKLALFVSGVVGQSRDEK